MVKKAGLAASLAIALAMALALVGCQEEKSAQEQLTEWSNLESVNDYRKESNDYLQKLSDGCDPSSPMSLKECAETSAQLEMLCEDVINESNVPKKCEQAHSYLVESAKETMEASDLFTDANIAVSTNDMIKATHKVNEAAGHIAKSTDALNKMNEEVNKLKNSNE